MKNNSTNNSTQTQTNWTAATGRDAARRVSDPHVETCGEPNVVPIPSQAYTPIVSYHNEKFEVNQSSTKKPREVQVNRFLRT